MARHLTIAGRVQGVGYRAWLCNRATAHGLRGWVRNAPDGTVEALIDGDPAAIASFIQECWTGPRAASVERVDDTACDAAAPAGFTIRHG